jgi:hypothetical protein
VEIQRRKLFVTISEVEEREKKITPTISEVGYYL